MDINNVKNIKNLNTLDKVMRTVLSENADTGYNYNNKCYYPVLEVGSIIQCQFIGIGSEFNDLHFGVVWSVSSAKETLLVVPLTSKPIERTKAQFSIGKISNFITSTTDTNVKDSYVYVNKITEASRKKIKLWFQKDSNGRVIKDSSRYNLPVKINQSQIDRIREGVELELLHKENYLLHLLNKIDVSYLPVATTNDDIFKMGYRIISSNSIIYKNNELTLYFTLDGKDINIKFKKLDKIYFNNRANYSEDTVKYHNNKITRQKNILKSLFSEISLSVNKAKTFLPNE